MAEAIKKTRLREGGIKRWSDIEVKNMLDYVRSHTNFEVSLHIETYAHVCNYMSKSQKPTARLYYLKLLEETKIETKWNLARCKMRHLKTLFVKANEFLNSTGAGVEDEDGDLTIQGKSYCVYLYTYQYTHLIYFRKDKKDMSILRHAVRNIQPIKGSYRQGIRH